MHPRFWLRSCKCLRDKQDGLHAFALLIELQVVVVVVVVVAAAAVVGVVVVVVLLLVLVLVLLLQSSLAGYSNAEPDPSREFFMVQTEAVVL